MSLIKHGSELVRPFQGVTKRCRLSWLYEPKCGGRGGVAGSQPMSTAEHRSPNKLWRSNSIFNLCAFSSLLSKDLNEEDFLCIEEHANLSIIFYICYFFRRHQFMNQLTSENTATGLYQQS